MLDIKKTYIRNVIFSVLTVSCRLISSSIIFVLLARWMDRSDFSLVVYFSSSSFLTAIIIDFGLGIKFSRDGAIETEKRHDLFSTLLFTKLTLSIAYIFITIIHSSLHSLYQLEFFLMAISVLIQSFIEFTSVYFRLLGKFHLETIIAVTNATLILTMIWLGYLVYHDQLITVVPLAFVVARTLVLILIFSMIFRLQGNLNLVLPRLRSIRNSIKSSSAYFMDRLVTVIYNNGDIILIKVLLGVNFLAPYQSAMKLSSAFLSGATAVNNVFLPKLSSHPKNDKFFLRKTLLGILTVGSIVSFSLIVGLKGFISNSLFNDKFLELPILLPYFGWYVFLRFYAAYFGVLLTAKGFQRKRTKANGISIITFFLSSVLLSSKFGIVGIALGLIISTSLLIILFNGVLIIAKEKVFSKFIYCMIVGFILIQLWTNC